MSHCALFQNSSFFFFNLFFLSNSLKKFISIIKIEISDVYVRVCLCVCVYKNKYRERACMWAKFDDARVKPWSRNYNPDPHTEDSRNSLARVARVWFNHTWQSRGLRAVKRRSGGLRCQRADHVEAVGTSVLGQPYLIILKFCRWKDTAACKFGGNSVFAPPLKQGTVLYFLHQSSTRFTNQHFSIK